MELTNLISQGKEKIFELINRASTAFPYSNDLIHVGIIGAAPFIAGKYSSELLGRKIPFFKKYSNTIGFASSLVAEGLWQLLIEPNSPFDHPSDIISDYKGIGETALGASLAYAGTKISENLVKTNLEKQD